MLLASGLFLASWLPAQAPVPNQPTDPTGVAAPWDISQTVAALAAQTSHLKPILDEVTPPDWVTKGAPVAYVQQWQNAKRELADVERDEQSLEKQPDRLSLALDTYFRLQSLETRLNSLVDGARRYQSPVAGDMFVAAVGESAANRDKLRDYISDLATQKEQEFSVVDREAQRCRTTLNRQPAALPQSTPRRAPAPKAAPKQP